MHFGEKDVVLANEVASLAWVLRICNIPGGDSCAGRIGVEEPGHPIGLPLPHGSSFLVPNETTIDNGIPGGPAMMRALWCVGRSPRLSPSFLCIVSYSFNQSWYLRESVYIAIGARSRRIALRSAFSRKPLLEMMFLLCDSV